MTKLCAAVRRRDFPSDRRGKLRGQRTPTKFCWLGSFPRFPSTRADRRRGEPCLRVSLSAEIADNVYSYFEHAPIRDTIRSFSGHSAGQRKNTEQITREKCYTAPEGLRRRCSRYVYSSALIFATSRVPRAETSTRATTITRVFRVPDPFQEDRFSAYRPRSPVSLRHPRPPLRLQHSRFSFTARDPPNVPQRRVSELRDARFPRAAGGARATRNSAPAAGSRPGRRI